jgi:hypothetical protein
LRNLVAAVFRFEQAQSPANIEDIINLLSIPPVVRVNTNREVAC